MYRISRYTLGTPQLFFTDLFFLPGSPSFFNLFLPLFPPPTGGIFTVPRRLSPLILDLSHPIRVMRFRPAERPLRPSPAASPLTPYPSRWRFALVQLAAFQTLPPDCSPFLQPFCRFPAPSPRMPQILFRRHLPFCPSHFMFFFFFFSFFFFFFS